MLAKGSRNKTVISLGSVSSACSAGSAVPRSAVPQISLTPENVENGGFKALFTVSGPGRHPVLLNSKVLLPD